MSKDHLNHWEDSYQCFALALRIRNVYLFTGNNPIKKPNERIVMPPTPDPDSELAAILTYCQAANAYIGTLNTQIAALQAASAANPSATDSDSPDVEAAIQAIIAFQTSNPIPAPPAPVTTPVTPPASS